MTMSTAVITVLHSVDVVHIPHESWSSLILGYPLCRWVPLHTSRVCPRTPLQGCSMVFPSLLRTRWGFTGSVSLDHQGPLLPHVVPKRVHSLTHSYPTRRIPRESTQSAPLIDTPNLVLPHTTPGRTHIGSWLYCCHGWSLHEPVLRFGYDDYHRLPESIGQSPELLESTERSSKPVTPNPYSSY
jgi:hypothetical protein